MIRTKDVDACHHNGKIGDIPQLGTYIEVCWAEDMDGVPVIDYGYYNKWSNNHDPGFRISGSTLTFSIETFKWWRYVTNKVTSGGCQS